MAERRTGSKDAVAAAATRRPGRRLDTARNAAILDAALIVLADVGYDTMTIDMVAARSNTARATVYRRWATKADLAIAAVSHMSEADAGHGALPDTGTLRGDFIATITSHDASDQELRIRVMSGLVTLARTDPRLASLGAGAGLDPWITASRTLIQRAVDRGEYAAVDVETLGQVIPMICVCRAAVQQEPITPEFAMSLIDHVVLPAMGPRLII